MISKADIGHWTGLTGVELGHLINLLHEKNVDWETVDWQVLGEEAQDYGDRYGAIWSKLANEYGIGKPVVESQIGQEMEEYGAEEEEFLHGTKEGVKEILSRIYKDPSISKKQKEAMKQALKEESSAYFTTLIALYDGEEQSFAKRWLGEEVVAPTPEDVKQLINKPIFSVLSRKGWIKAIDGVYLKHPMRSTKFVKLIPDYKLLHSEDRGEPGRVAVYRRPEEKPTVILKPPEIILEPKEKPLYIKPDEKELTILQNIDNAKRALALHKKRKDTTMIEQDETLLGNYERMLEAYRRYKEKQLEEPERVSSGELSTMFTRVWDNNPIPGTDKAKGFRYKLKNTYGEGGFLTREEAEKQYLSKVSPKHKEILKPPEPEPLEAQKRRPEPVPPAIREMIIKPVEIIPTSKEDLYSKAEKLACDYSYGDVQKMMKDNQLYPAGTKVKMFVKLIEAGAI